jgi:hypothetical protein
MRRRAGRGLESGGGCASSEMATAAMASLSSASVTPARARGRRKGMARAREVEVAARFSLYARARDVEGGCSTWSTRGGVLLPGRHDARCRARD